MTAERQLPPDPGRWPKNPYELLAVPRDVDRTTLRRAYVELIRKYKPEHFPDQFRRIRDAYDAINHWLEWKGTNRNQFSGPDNNVPTNIAQIQPQPLDADTGGNKEPDSNHSPKSRLGITDPLQLNSILEDGPTKIVQFWQQAAGGDAQTAYRQLVEMELQSVGMQALYLCLYWLLKLNPELDSQRTPIFWLLRGIARDYKLSPLVQLYCLEIEDQPEEGTSQGCAALVKSAAGFSSIAPLVYARWSAAKKLGCWQTITDDLVLLRPIISPKTASGWAQLISMAFEQLAWSDDLAARSVRQELLKELEFIPEAQQISEAAHMQFDLLFSLQVEYPIASKNNQLADLIALIPAAWPRPSRQVQSQLLKVIAGWGDNFQAAFQVFDQIAKYSPSVIAYLVDCVRTIAPNDRRTSTMNDEIAMAVHGFTRTMAGRTYEQVRAPLLDLCLREQIAPDELSRLSPQATYFPLPAGRTLTDLARSDAPICLAYYSHQAISK
jgi:hypothetical protein